MNLNLISTAYADSAATTQATTATPTTTGTPTAAQPQPSFLSMITLFAPMFLVFYFLLIRPQQKKMKEHQSLLEKVKHGDEILTNGGMFGKVTGITDKVLTVEISDGVKVRMLKNQVASINPTLTEKK